jgi:hypothetical protein
LALGLRNRRPLEREARKSYRVRPRETAMLEPGSPRERYYRQVG